MKKTIIIITKTGLTLELKCDDCAVERQDGIVRIKFLKNGVVIGSFYEIQGWYEEVGERR